MFSFISNDKLVPATVKSSGQYLFELDIEESDYMYHRRLCWDHFRGDVYKFDIGNTKIEIPSTFYIMITDEYGEIDWIPVDEIIDRDIDVVTVDKDFSAWRMERLVLIDQLVAQDYAFPQTKNAIPISTDGKRCVIIAKADKHTETGDKRIDMVVA